MPIRVCAKPCCTVAWRTITKPFSNGSRRKKSIRLRRLRRACTATTESLFPADLVSAGFKRSEEHTSELQSRRDLVCRLLLEKKKNQGDGPNSCSVSVPY